jgi:hypothetical protein
MKEINTGKIKNNQIQCSRVVLNDILKEQRMFKLFNQQRTESEPVNFSIDPPENNLKFWSHSFSTTHALALLCCGPCATFMRDNTTSEKNLVCRLSF